MWITVSELLVVWTRYCKEESRSEKTLQTTAFFLRSSAGMRQLPQESPPFVDGEGFPQGTEVGLADRRDQESGELLCTKVMCVRKRPEFRVSPRIQSYLSSKELYRSHGDGRQFSGFRIPQFHSDRMRVCRPGRPKNLVGPQLQTCVYLEGGMPVHYTRRPLDPHGPSLGVVRRHDGSVREAFRVPKDSLPKATDEQPFRNPNTLYVNIWEEFIFGKSVIPKSKTSRAHVREVEEEGCFKFIHRILSSFLPKFAVDLLTYIVYFFLFFVSCVGYNMFCDLGCYILFAQHLKIHERADEEKLEVVFTGSLFQGPLYAMTRNWCEHCNQRERAKVMWKLMRKMKTDILPPSNPPDAPLTGAVQAPS